MPPVAPRTSKLAVWSLILGCLFFIPPVGIVALVLGIIAITKISSSEGALAGKGYAIAGTVLGSLSILLVCSVVPWLMVMPALNQANLQAQSVSCRSNLKQLGLSFAMYQSDYGGGLPPNLQMLADQGYAKDPDLFACPAVGSASLDPSDLDATSSYYYARVTRPENVVGRIPLMWEKRYAHTASGVNVLFSDFSVAFMPRGNFEKALEAASGFYDSPPEMPSQARENELE